MKVERRKLNDTELRDWLDRHFVYSVELFSLSAELYGTGKYSGKAAKDTPHYAEHWCIEMALLQTFVTELRNLHDFFYSPIPDKEPSLEDGRALDYFETEAEIAHWQAARPTKSQLHVESYRQIGARLAHLTRKRDEDFEWQVLPLWNEVYGVIKIFLTCASASRKGNVPQRLSWLDDQQRAFLPFL